MGGNALHQCNAARNIPCEDVDYRNCRFDPKPANPVNPVNPVERKR